MSYFKRARKYNKPSVTLDEKIAKANQEFKKTGVLEYELHEDDVHEQMSTKGLYYADKEIPAIPAEYTPVPDPNGVTQPGFTPPDGGHDANDPSTWDTAFKDTDWLRNPNEVAGETDRQAVLGLPDSMRTAAQNSRGGAEQSVRYPDAAGEGGGFVIAGPYWGTGIGYLGKSGEWRQVLSGGLTGGTNIPHEGSRGYGGYYNGLTDAEFENAVWFWEKYQGLIAKYGSRYNIPTVSTSMWIPWSYFWHGSAAPTYEEYPYTKSNGMVIAGASVVTEGNEYESSPYVPAWNQVIFQDDLGNPSNLPVKPLDEILGDLYEVGNDAIGGLIDMFTPKPDPTVTGDKPSPTQPIDDLFSNPSTIFGEILETGDLSGFLTPTTVEGIVNSFDDLHDISVDIFNDLESGDLDLSTFTTNTDIFSDSDIFSDVISNPSSPYGNQDTSTSEPHGHTKPTDNNTDNPSVEIGDDQITDMDSETEIDAQVQSGVEQIENSASSWIDKALDAMAAVSPPLMRAIFDGLSNLENLQGSGLGGNIQLGYHGTSIEAMNAILSPTPELTTSPHYGPGGIQGFRPGSPQNIYATPNVFAAPTNNINNIPQAAANFSERGGQVARSLIDRFTTLFGSASTSSGSTHTPGGMIPTAFPSGSGPGMNFLGYTEISADSATATKGTEFVQRLLEKYPNSHHAQQLLNTGNLSNSLQGVAGFAQQAGEFAGPVANALGVFDTVTRTAFAVQDIKDGNLDSASYNVAGALLSGLSFVAGPVGAYAAAAQIILDGVYHDGVDYKPAGTFSNFTGGLIPGTQEYQQMQNGTLPQYSIPPYFGGQPASRVTETKLYQQYSRGMKVLSEEAKPDRAKIRKYKQKYYKTSSRYLSQSLRSTLQRCGKITRKHDKFLKSIDAGNLLGPEDAPMIKEIIKVIRTASEKKSRGKKK